MKIKSFGCSFIFGSDLQDSTLAFSNSYGSKHTWPALLAKHHGHEYQCLARPGCGNLQIAESVLNNFLDQEPSLFIIGWTWINRFDYSASEYISTDPVQGSWKNWQTIRPIKNDNLTQTYYKYFDSEFKDKLTSLIYIKLVIDTLNQKNIPFIMTYMDNLLFCKKWNYTNAVLELQDFIEPYMTTFEGQTFLEWSRGKGYNESSNWHPLEEAHRHAFELIDSYNLL